MAHMVHRRPHKIKFDTYRAAQYYRQLEPAFCFFCRKIQPPRLLLLFPLLSPRNAVAITEGRHTFLFNLFVQSVKSRSPPRPDFGCRLHTVPSVPFMFLSQAVLQILCFSHLIFFFFKSSWAWSVRGGVQ